VGPHDLAMSMSIQEISDRLEIEQLLARYCHAIDRRDWDAYRAVYTPDAVIDDGTAGPGNSVDDMVAFLSRVLSRVPLTQHSISASVVEIAGDTAHARTVCQCPAMMDVGGGETRLYFMGTWYVDDLVRTDDGWRIAKRAEADFFHNLPPELSLD
jgi:ketosteroid isomerase-like protein